MFDPNEDEAIYDKKKIESNELLNFNEPSQQSNKLLSSEKIQNLAEKTYQAWNTMREGEVMRKLRADSYPWTAKSQTSDWIAEISDSLKKSDSNLCRKLSWKWIIESRMHCRLNGLWMDMNGTTMPLPKFNNMKLDSLPLKSCAVKSDVNPCTGATKFQKSWNLNKPKASEKKNVLCTDDIVMTPINPNSPEKASGTSDSRKRISSTSCTPSTKKGSKRKRSLFVETLDSESKAARVRQFEQEISSLFQYFNKGFENNSSECSSTGLNPVWRHLIHICWGPWEARPRTDRIVLSLI